MEFFRLVNITDRIILYATNDYEKRFLWLSVLLGGILYLVLYAFEAVALYTIAVRGGYKNKWFAFVPFLNTYYIGVLSEKNKLFNVRSKYFSLAAAITEGVCFSVETLNLVAMFLIFGGGYAEPQFEDAIIGGMSYSIFTETYVAINLPASLEWAWGVFAVVSNYLGYLMEVVWIILEIFVISSFFRTYATPRYMLFTILSAIFPIKGIFMFCVRNNKPKNYGEYLRERQRRQYQAYQEYMRSNGNYYGGGQNNGGGAHHKNEPDDPFGGLGGSGASGSDGKKHFSRRSVRRS